MKISKYLPTSALIIVFLIHFQPVKSTYNSWNFEDFGGNSDQILQNYTFKQSIKTVQLHKKNWELSYPVLDMADRIPLVLTFDELGHQAESYSYTLTHCNHLWEPTNIIKSDYISGLQDEVILDYQFSRNTHQDFVHYTVEIPNDNMQLKISGNYVLTVYEDYDPEKVILSRRLYVVDSRVKIEGSAMRSNNLELFYTHHEVDFKVMHAGLQLDDPLYNIQVVVMQNLDWNTAITDLTPTYMAVDELIYDYEEENQFQALSEFRHFETKNLNYITEGIETIRFERPLNHVYLIPEKPKSSGEYVFDQDINGKFLITYHLDYDPATGADYTMVHFNLPFEAPITGGDLYIYGGLSDWSFNPQFKLDYNFQTKAYEGNVLLKQGYYNYHYRFLPEKHPHDPSFMEGSFYETENDYLIFVYYQDIRSRHLQLVGFKSINNIPEKSQ